MRGRLIICAVLAVTLVAAGCGGSGKGAPKTAAAGTTSARCKQGVQARWTARLRRDVAAIRRAARLKTTDSLKGNPAVNTATDRFLADVGKAPVDLLAKNRFIDHAAAALAGSCQLCFQALEAERPIPAISHAGRCGA
jgi:hypothetical protein